MCRKAMKRKLRKEVKEMKNEEKLLKELARKKRTK